MRVPVCYSTDGTLIDGVVAGPKPALAKVFSIIQELGPPLGLFIKAGKCELFGLGDLSSFSPLMKRSSVPTCNFEILVAPIGDIIFCAKFFAHKRANASMMLEQLEDAGAVDPQVALLLLRQCGGFCKLVHLATVAVKLNITHRLSATILRRCRTI